jgi:hypothetical protein
VHSDSKNFFSKTVGEPMLARCGPIARNQLVKM